MDGLEFKFEWEDADGVKGCELASTWASLLVRVNDTVLTRVLDHRDGRVRQQIHVPLYPLAEWLATNWWFLMHEPEFRGRNPSVSFMDRHRTGPSLEGYCFPNVCLVSDDTVTRVDWTHDRLQWSGLEFLERQGSARIGKDEFRRASAGFVAAVVQRLESRHISGTLVQDEWAAIQGAEQEEREFCKVAAAIGWDPYSIDDSQQKRVLRIGQVLSGAVFEEAIRVLNSENLDSEIDAIVRVLREGKSTGIPLERFTSIRDEVVQAIRSVSNHSHSPWTVGYSLARQVRTRLELEGSPLPSWPTLSKALREPQIARGRITRSVAFDRAPLVEGVVTTDRDGLPAVAIPYGRSDTSRFRFCRSLADILISPKTDTLLTKGHSARQKRGRAFAAEFLAPSSDLKARVRKHATLLHEEDIDELAGEFGVSPWVVVHQVKNHGIADVTELGAH